jgi:hypothetical protein
VSTTAYYLAWLGVGLTAIALASALIVRHLRMGWTRQVMAARLFDALDRCSVWVAAQRHAMLLQPDAWGGDAALEEVRTIQREWFVPLEREAQELYAAHAQLAEFLRTQQALRLADTEAWLLSDPDTQFMTLWRQHRAAAHALAVKLEGVAGVRANRAVDSASSFPA